MKDLSLAFVLPRYGKSLGGGAETLVGSLVAELQRGALQRVGRIEVWATCAIDHRTWEDFFPPGLTEEEGITVRRFPVSPRDLEKFIQAEFSIRDHLPMSTDQQLEWLEHSVNSQELYAHIAAHGQEFDAIFFAPYLFATSFWGSLIHPERSILFPCLHDENYAYLPVFRHLFQQVRGLIFNAALEWDLAREIYALEELDAKGAVVGMGFEDSKQGVLADSAALSGSAPYLLYSGRKEQGKNLDLLIEYFVEHRTKHPESDLQLLLIGSGEINFLDQLPEGVKDLGFVSEEEKLGLMKGALALCQPSTNESFSIVLMEAWQQETPVLVHANCPVTRDHAVKSGGGLFFANQQEFLAVVDYLLEDSGRREDLGRSGKAYVETEYSWSAVVQRFEAALIKFGIIEELSLRNEGASC